MKILLSFYLLQDFQREDGLFDISAIKSNNGNIEFYTENNGKIWEVSSSINLITKNNIKDEHFLAYFLMLLTLLPYLFLKF